MFPEELITFSDDDAAFSSSKRSPSDVSPAPGFNQRKHIVIQKLIFQSKEENCKMVRSLLELIRSPAGKWGDNSEP